MPVRWQICLLMERNPESGGKRRIWGYRWSDHSPWESHLSCCWGEGEWVGTEASKIVMAFRLWRQQWRTSCLRLFILFYLFIYLFAVKEEVMLFADKRENVMGGFPKRVQSSPLSMVSLSMVSVTCSQAQSENIKWKIPETSHSKV